MRLIPWIVAAVSMVGGARFTLQAPTDDVLKTLNALLASSCYNRPVLQLAADATVVRRDADGGTMTFKLADIGEVTIDTDNEAHVLLLCKADRPCIERSDPSGAVGTSLRLLAFSISPVERGESVMRLFKELRASPAGVVKK
jgi:hypothetical protein